MEMFMSHTSAEKFECGSTFFRLTARDGVRCSLARVANKRGNLANVYNTVTLSLFDQPHFVNQICDYFLDEFLK